MRDTNRDNYFTKHLFGAGLECATKLYYYSCDYPENKQSAPFIEHAGYNKRLLKALLRSLYPDGIFVNEKSIAKSAVQTQTLLNKDTTVFDAVFEYEQMIARLPVVIKSGKALTVYHVQTKAFDSRKHRLANSEGQIYSKWRKYLLDFAYQLFLIRNNYPDCQIHPILVMPEKTGLAHTDQLPFLMHILDKGHPPEAVSEANQELLAKLDVQKQIREIWDDPHFARRFLPKDTFEKSVTYLRDLFVEKVKEDVSVGFKCKNCEFRIEKERTLSGTKSGFLECWEPIMNRDNLLDSHVFDLIGPGTNQWMQHQIYDQKDVIIEKGVSPTSIARGNGRLTHQIRQQLQVFKARGEKIPKEIFRPQLLRELQRWEYPLHFLDFEAGNYSVPVRKKRSPYDVVVFQFSCHSLHEDGSWVHHQWLDDFENRYASYELVRQLMKVPDINLGTIVQYSDFERNALKAIRRELMRESYTVEDADKLIEWIETFIHRKDSTASEPPYMADLSRQVRNFYYNREMENSLSIKDVLKSIMSLSPFLKEKYSQPYSSENFDQITWWKPNGRGGARNPYKILMESGDSPIRRGTEAMIVYGKLIAKQIDPEQLVAYRQAMLKYCELDTLAMVMIYQHWQQTLKEGV